jgi:hypothetical protein
MLKELVDSRFFNSARSSVIVEIANLQPPLVAYVGILFGRRLRKEQTCPDSSDHG